MYSVILCGGSGTRLWPLSRKNFPKQFLNLYSDKSLLQETFLRMKKVMPAKNIFLITNRENYFNVYNQLRDVYPRIAQEQIIAEPASRNTAPAIALAVKFLTEKIKINKTAPIIVLPSDHYIGNVPAFVRLAKSALKKIGGSIGTIGIKPTAPETGYGYIRKGKKNKNCHPVAEFKEKPDRSTAEKYLASGEYVWNSGMYLFNAKTFEQEIRKHSPQIYNLYRQKLALFLDKFSELESEAIDTALSEKSQKMVVLEGNFGWSDIGSFDSLSEIAAARNQGRDRHILLDSKNIFVHSSTNRLVTALGVEDLVVIENNDCILIHKRGRSDEVRKVVSHLKEKNYKELDHNIIVYRPWGKYEVLINDKNHKVKKITVLPGASLSLQSHNHRSEHWVVVRGKAKVINGDKTSLLKKNESAYIPAKSKHRLSNPGKINLEIIEVQTGSYLEEDDLIRYDDNYNRLEK